jgi:hypothetical protein
MIPVYFGYKQEDFDNPFWCAIDFTLPSILVPNVKCKDCTGQKFDKNQDQLVPKEKFTYPHSMMYWKYTSGSFEVQGETQMMVLGTSRIK